MSKIESFLVEKSLSNNIDVNLNILLTKTEG